MALFDKLLNPAWHEVSKLSEADQLTVSIIITSYGGARSIVYDSIVKPLEGVLPDHTVKSGRPLYRESLVDEAFLGLCSCCELPATDPSSRLSRRVVQNLLEVWATFVLADVKQRSGGTGPEVLDQSGYSKDLDEARTQVAVKWMRILKISDPNIVSVLNNRGFADAWESTAKHMVSGILTGMGRTPEGAIISRARKDLGAMPPHQSVLVKYMITRIIGSR